MRNTCTAFFASVLLLAGCSDSIQEREQYRWIIGEFCSDLMLTSMHLNEVVMHKAIDGNATEQDLQRIEDSLAALKRRESRLELMLNEMYEKPELRTRDEAFMPLIREIIASTDALARHLRTSDKTNREKYFKHRDAFMQELDKMKEQRARQVESDRS